MRPELSRTFLAACFIFISLSAQALTHTETINDLTITVYAPDWIWQKSAVNILITIENSGSTEESVHLALTPPDLHVDHFTIDPGIIQGTTLVIPADDSLRHAFTNIIALGHVERQVYDFSITATTDDQSVTVSYPLTTIRGPVVNTAKWAMMLPAIICAAWCLVFIVALRRFATPGAWKVPSQLEFTDTDPDECA
ncbi:MAG: hypothetical protein VCD00_02830 [Candidatus Hydrogenedentota bacterium]